MGTIANAKVTHYYNCYNGDFIGCLHFMDIVVEFLKLFFIDFKKFVLFFVTILVLTISMSFSTLNLCRKIKFLLHRLSSESGFRFLSQ